MKTWRKWTALCVCLVLGAGLFSGCSATNQEQYERGQLYLGFYDYESASSIFNALGGYEDAYQYALYCQALLALEEEELERAYMDFVNLSGFQQSDLYIQYLDARMLEEEGRLEDAQEQYRWLGSFKDSAVRKDLVEARIPERDYAAAKTLLDIGQYKKAAEAFQALDSYQDSAALYQACISEIFQEDLTNAQDLVSVGDYQGALTALAAMDAEALNQADQLTLDRKRETCLQAIYKEAETSAKLGIEAAAAAMTLYDSLEGYKDSEQKKADIAEKYGLNMNLCSYNGTWQMVELGMYPQTAAGDSMPILWRVLTIKEGKALLVSDSILEVLPIVAPEDTETELIVPDFLQAFGKAALTKEAAAAITNDAGKQEAFLLSKADVENPSYGFVDFTSRQASGTLYTQSRELRTAGSGSGCWWLSDAGETDGARSIIYYNGAVYATGVLENDVRTGIRPAIWLDLEKYAFTKGQGSRELPYK